MKLRIAARASDLAQWQAHHVAGLLRSTDPALDVTVESISTRGDREVDPALADIGGQGLFTAEVDRAILSGEADLAVHSLKDLPVESPEGIHLVAIPPRAPFVDVLLSVGGARLSELPHGARVGTSSPRRAAFLRSVRPDLEIVNLRGNVPTRVGRVAPGDLAATVLASAGLTRLDLREKIAETLGPPQLLPAPGQGALAVTIRAGDEALCERVVALDHAPTRQAVEAERAVLAGLGGGCSLPLGVLAEPIGDEWRLASVMFLEEGLNRLDDERSGPDPLRLAAEAATALRKMGAPV